MPLPPHTDKLVHFFLFAVLARLFYIPLSAINRPGMRASLMALALAALYGITDEYHQMHVPGRNADLLDWLADVAGAGTVLIQNLSSGWRTVRKTTDQ